MKLKFMWNFLSHIDVQSQNTIILVIRVKFTDEDVSRPIIIDSNSFACTLDARDRARYYVTVIPRWQASLQIKYQDKREHNMVTINKCYMNKSNTQTFNKHTTQTPSIIKNKKHKLQHWQ